MISTQTHNNSMANYKIVLVGDSGVGKTNLLASFAKRAKELNLSKQQVDPTVAKVVNKFEQGFSEQLPPTIGSEFYSTKLTHPTDGTLIRVQIWDTAGQERYRAIAPGHYRRAAGAVLVYDCAKKKSLDNAINSWLPELEQWPLRSCVMLIGNKLDLVKTTNEPIQEVKTSDRSSTSVKQDSVNKDVSANHGDSMKVALDEEHSDSSNVEVSKGIEQNNGDSSQHCSTDPNSEWVSLDAHGDAARKANVAGSIRVSAKTGENVVDAFHRLIFLIHEQEQMRNKRNQGESNQEYNSSISLSYLQQGMGNIGSETNMSRVSHSTPSNEAVPCQCT